MSDDDWFEKDINDFVVKTKVEGNVVEQNELEEENVNQELTWNPDEYFDLDYGGNYKKSLPQNKTKTKQSCNSSQFIQNVPLKKLFFISEQIPLNTFLELSDVYFEFIETLNDINISSATIEATLKIIAFICGLPLIENIQNFVKKIYKNEAYFDKILTNAKRILHEIPKFKKKINFEINLDNYLNNLFVLCKTISKNLDYDQYFIRFIDNLHQELLLSKHETITSLFGKLQLEINGKMISTVSREIYPNLDDIKDNGSIILKPNIVEGRYANIESYLDIQLSLLREDFISPLRDGIFQFKNETDENKTKNFNVFTYPKVKIIIKEYEYMGRKEEQIVVDLNESKLAVEGTEENPILKKFLYGNLLCFSTTDEFIDLSLAVVSNRNLDLLKKGFIQIELIHIDNKVTNIFDKNFILLESEVYFEPYHQVYKVLKNLDSNNFPLEKYIINCEQTTEYPDYVPDAPKIYYKHMKYVFNLKDVKSWPSPSSINLDPSQFNALHAALTRKFCIIQGPPGTGKTYVGLQIVSALLENTDSQILIICYTNHALDQFLNGILKCTDDIVRMGNQSKNIKLNEFNIKQLKDLNVYDKRIKTWYYLTKNEHQNLLQKFEGLQKKLQKINGSEEKLENYEDISKEILKVQIEMRSTSKRLEELKQITEYHLIKNKRIIAMTTTCAARNHILLQLLKTPIVIFEEAAEILESHIVASITKETQHIILIGDHQQLRPTTSVYRLAKHYKMDISLFERMINNNINCYTLTTQHRMKPEIANLIRPHIYSNLLDADNVIDLPKILGVEKSLFFFTHTNYESNMMEDETTKKNLFEVQFVIGLCSYLLQQGYKPIDITILTTYNGQLFQLYNERRNLLFLRGIHINVVDNYQGEECKIIILSLVRSNPDNIIGYLAMRNRINVAFSRAQEGFFIVGNMTMLSASNSTWKTIEKELIEQNAISDEFPLRCIRHGNITLIKEPTDFKEIKFGGCTGICGFIMECGHMCDSICHSEKFIHSSDCSCEEQ